MDSGGTRDPFAMNVFAFAPADPWRRLIHVFWLEKMRMHGKPIAEMLIGPDPETHPGTPRGGVFSVIGWPDVIEFDADQPSIDELANVYGIRAKKCDRRADYKFGAIELVNGDLLAAAPDGELPARRSGSSRARRSSSSCRTCSGRRTSTGSCARTRRRRTTRPTRSSTCAAASRRSSTPAA
jgi:hypothetical protein